MEMDVILNELIAESGQASLPTDIWQKEINAFRNELRPLMGSDPLDWWRKSQYRYPYLSKILYFLQSIYPFYICLTCTTSPIIYSILLFFYYSFFFFITT